MANKNLFTQIQVSKPNRNVFDLTHDVKLSARFGRLTPVLLQECVPGDKFVLSVESIIRFAPLIAPVMHRMDVSFHTFFVPNRLTWSNWETFITGDNLNPTNPTSTPVMPYLNLNAANTQVDGLANYMGVPQVTGGNTVRVSALPFAAYQKVYQDYYRDQNLILPTEIELSDGDNAGIQSTLLEFRTRAWEHDYFTSALPWAQKGDAVDIPLAPFGDVPVKLIPENYGPTGSIEINNGGIYPDATVPTGTPAWQDVGNTSSMYAETSTLDAVPTTINDLRRAFKLQEWLEKNARAGTRYTESLRVHFNVTSSDKRLQRPEYITGVKTPVIVSEVLNTTGEDGGLPQGNMAGHAISVTGGKAGNYYCEEHGYIITIMSILPRTAYQQGLPKHFFKFDKLDYFWPTFQNLGEQEILSKEIYADQAPIDQEVVFGYTPRYADYKYTANRVAGEFQTTLNYWHMGRIFGGPPALSQQFVEADPTTRIFAVTDPDADYLYCQVLNKITANRPMSYFGTPSF